MKMKRCHRLALMFLCLAQLQSVNLGATEPLSPQEDDLTVAYEAFVGIGALDDALRVAQQAVLNVPADLEWRRRLARAADWTQAPELAYTHWKYLLTHGLRDAEVMGSVERLAEYNNDHLTLIYLWHGRAQTQRLTDAQWRTLAHYYDQAAIPLVGAQQFAKDYNSKKNPLLGELAAQLYINAGEDVSADQLYDDLLQNHKARLPWVMARARHHIVRDELHRAYTILREHRTELASEAYDYWRLLAALAWTLQDDEVAQYAYRRVVQAPDVNEQEITRYSTLLLPNNPHEAAGQAERAYRLTGSPQRALGILNTYFILGDYTNANRFQATLDTQTLNALESDPHFLTLRSYMHESGGDVDAAMDDLSKALDLAPADVDIRVRALWLFYDSRRSADLRQLLKRIGRDALKDERYWPVCGIAYHSLNELGKAAVFYRLQLQNNPDDIDAMLGYADLLEQRGRSGMAKSLRSQAWRQVQAGASDIKESQSIAMAYDRLSLYQATGVNVGNILRRLVTQARLQDKADDHPDHLLLGWALDHDAYQSAEGWVKRRFNRDGRVVPPWVRTQLALAANDDQALSTLLRHENDQLTANARYDIAQQLGAERLAMQTAFEGMSASPDDGFMHERYVNAATSSAHWIELNVARREFEFFNSDLTEAGFGFRLFHDLRLNLGYSIARQSSTDEQQLPFVPEHDKRATANLTWSKNDTRLSFALHHADELDSYAGGHLRLTHRPTQRLLLGARIGIKDYADASTALLIGGMEDSFSLTADYRWDRRWYTRITPKLSRYRTQHDHYLGSGRRIDWELGYRLREDFPDWILRVGGSHDRYDADGEADTASLALFDDATVATTPASRTAGLFLPDDADYYRACAAAGILFSGQPLLQSWHPFGELCATSYNDGFTALLGAVGPIAGGDRLTITLRTGHGGARSEDRQTLILTAAYKHYF